MIVEEFCGIDENKCEKEVKKTRYTSSGKKTSQHLRVWQTFQQSAIYRLHD